ncbi:replication initiation protein [Pontibacter toksunensis]|uniref:Replication initiation protein n=1 Tax=Pontibacter toksunensis TaxID=1332631 RepID=A0ABW6BZZ2_9BACT
MRQEPLTLDYMDDQLSMFTLGPKGDLVPADATPVSLRGDAQVALSNFLLNGQFRLNYIEWRLFFSMLSCIEESDIEFKDYFIRVQDIIELADLKSGSHLYEEVSKNIKSLMSHVVEWEEGPSTTRYAHLVTDATYYKKQGIVKITPHPDMKPHLLQLRKEFTQAQLKQCIRFSSTYTSRIYMLLKQFDSPKAGYRIMSITEFRFKLGLDYTQKLSKGKEVEYHLYPKYSDIRRWVLIPAQQEIAKTDIPFEFTPIKTGRKVTAIKFTLLKGKKLRATPETPPQTEQLTERQAMAYARMAKFRFTDHQIRRILQNGSLTDINKACYEVENTDYNKLGHPIENKTAYAYGIFKKKFGLD